MDYYLKPSKLIFSFRTIIFFIYSLCLFLFGDYLATTLDIVLVVVITVLWILSIIRLLYVWLRKKPVLTVNEIYIHEQLGDRKYYWQDIEDVVAENDYLKINFYETQKHPVKPYKRFRDFMSNGFSKKTKGKSSFYIYIYALDVSRDEFLETLNDFSIAAEDKG